MHLTHTKLAYVCVCPPVCVSLCMFSLFTAFWATHRQNNTASVYLRFTSHSVQVCVCTYTLKQSVATLSVIPLMLTTAMNMENLTLDSQEICEIMKGNLVYFRTGYVYYTKILSRL